MRRHAWGVILLLLLPACSARESLGPKAVAPRIEVVSCRLAASGEFVDVRFTAFGMEPFVPGPETTYLVHEATGQKFPIMRLQRIGRMAEARSPDGAPLHYIIFRNREGILKAGHRITLVVGPARQEHVLLSP